MEKLQLAKFAFLIIFLLLIPFVSSSLRPSYLYLLLNLLIVALGVEAGFLSGAPREEKNQLVTSLAVAAPATFVSDSAFGLRDAPKNDAKALEQQHHHRGVQVVTFHNPAKPAEQKLSVAEAKVSAAETVWKEKKLKRHPSRPSLFFIGGPEVETAYGGATAKESVGDREHEEKRWEEDEGALSKQDLFAKSETFIGNFYKQLKMQREESWKKIHGLYHRAF